MQFLFETVPAGDAEHAEVEIRARAFGEGRVEPSEGFAACAGGWMLGIDDGDAGSAPGKMVGQRCAEDAGAGDNDVSHRFV